MSISSSEERSKYASEPPSLRMKPQPIFLFSRVTEPRIFCAFVSSRGTSPVLECSALTFDSACACDSLYRQWADFYGFFAKPTFLNPIAHALTRRKRAKVHSVQRRLSEGNLFSIVATNHAFLLVSIDMPDHALHASHSCWFPKIGARFLCFVRGMAPWPAHSRQPRSQGVFPARATTC